MRDVLDSFYSDLASLDTPVGGSINSTPSDTPPCLSPAQSQQVDDEADTRVSSPDGRSNSPFRTSEVEDSERKKKKVKIPTFQFLFFLFIGFFSVLQGKYASSIELKKKGFGNMVAKWQNIQDEVKKRQS